MRYAAARLMAVAVLLAGSCSVVTASAKSRSLLSGTQGVQMDGVTVAWTLHDDSVTFTAEGMPFSCVHSEQRSVRHLRGCAARACRLACACALLTVCPGATVPAPTAAP
jgi:hypothetical protein